MDKILKVKASGAQVAGTHHFRVSEQFRVDVAQKEIAREVRRRIDPDNRQPIPKIPLAAKANAKNSFLYGYETAGLPIVLPGVEESHPMSHREVLFLDRYIEKFTDDDKDASRKTHALDYHGVLKLLNDGKNVCHASYLKLVGTHAN